ncbi:MAG: PfkB family carbohydrate kinase [Bdellovibrionales bacterium]|jgi:sugar/nucleoside kinase (ribokinase family)|nr:PfkB family carbohydrate kinase [Bdellovibrionales bacterium]
MSDILVVGSLAYDSISTPAGKTDRTLGGSANYFSIAASLFAPVKVVGVVGEDYADKDLALLTSRKVDVTGLQKKAGKTFHWAGAYDGNMNEAKTLQTDLNVFGDFNPELPVSYQDSQYVFLANIDPSLQLRVLEQVKKPKLVGADTMNFWISSKKDELLKVLSRIDALLINEGEAEMLTGKTNAIAASNELLKMGPKAVVVKRGEYGFVLRTAEGHFILSAFPIADVVDPTGAGDTFAGAFFGTLAKSNKGLDLASLKEACVNGCLLASFTVEAFGVARLNELTLESVMARGEQFSRITRL